MCISLKAHFRMAVVCCLVENSPYPSEFWALILKLYLAWNSWLLSQAYERFVCLNICCFHLDHLAPTLWTMLNLFLCIYLFIIICWIYFSAHALILRICTWCYVAAFLVCHSLKLCKRHGSFSNNVDIENLCNWYFILFALLLYLEPGYRLGSIVTDHLFIFCVLCVFQKWMLHVFSISSTVEG